MAARPRDLDPPHLGSDWAELCAALIRFFGGNPLRDVQRLPCWVVSSPTRARCNGVKCNIRNISPGTRRRINELASPGSEGYCEGVTDMDGNIFYNKRGIVRHIYRGGNRRS